MEAGVLITIIEVWKPILGFPNYIISNKGRVMSLEHTVRSKYKTRRQNSSLLKPFINDEGYSTVTLWNNGVPKRCRLHRLVAETFLGVSEFPVVNHKNFIRSDNRVENLEWCSISYNLLYSNVLVCSNMACRKGVNQYDKKNNFIKSWDSITEAAKECNTNTGNISYCCKGKRKTAAGYKWKYIN